ncbi:hypothetical protein GLOTRDRAFT_35746 [Gloeophyllum trabeum ATCC 11539]|uniref:Lysine decarboxylase n=1 Tax=Gloeophyllum trabeum (strain ATCC 11539 / FP-39264 / Madison 617) TaxID=670483 RepID=S7QHA9_GLOTA|nr:uncharacterized protein GLOTRDRAFT_35746 [Gloeophyllum trabeum ATCC 11539]EPQ58547.1 hypothetical protein GLOTRDRAFT_35746 [Gloeophyllum trabeum ATCC 11539]
MAPSDSDNRAIAVYCASSLGAQKAYQDAAISVGRALAAAKRPLVYGGGSKGIMGIVSGAVLEGGGQVTGVVPQAMVAAGGEGEKSTKGDPKDHAVYILLDERGREDVIVGSMHERKVEMAKRAAGFVALPGGFGTFEEVLEVATWTQLGIHNKPVVCLNVLSYWEPLRALVKNGVQAGFIQEKNESLIIFVDGPADHAEHESFDWGKAALEAVEGWDREDVRGMYDWNRAGNGDSFKVA